MINPQVGKKYAIKHSSGMIAAKFLRTQEYTAPKYRNTVFGTIRNDRRSTTHYVFENVLTGREIVIKSRVKIKREIMES